MSRLLGLCKTVVQMSRSIQGSSQNSCPMSRPMGLCKTVVLCQDQWVLTKQLSWCQGQYPIGLCKADTESRPIQLCTNVLNMCWDMKDVLRYVVNCSFVLTEPKYSCRDHELPWETFWHYWPFVWGIHQADDFLAWRAGYGEMVIILAHVCSRTNQWVSARKT